ncbi:MAG: pentapeptide repeat-containing protein [Bacillota bacterium]|nr:pentapeptide repeat-containing protein [Bacillota bacterium]
MKYVENQEFINKKITKLENIQFIDCIFENCSFERCEIKNTQFFECTIKNSRMVQINFIHSQMRNCSFSKCECIGVSFGNVVPLGSVNTVFQECKNSFFKYCIFQGMNMNKFQGITNVFEQCSFHHCELKQANFNGCLLRNSDFQQSNIMKADFRESYGYMIDPRNNQIKGAMFSIPEVLHLLDEFQIKLD